MSPETYDQSSGAAASRGRGVVGVIHRLPVYRNGLLAGLAEAGYAASALACFGEARTVRASACLVELPPDASVVAGLIAGRPDITFVAITRCNDYENVGAALRFGFGGIVSEDAEVDDIVHALDEALVGRIALPAAIAKSLIRNGSADTKQPPLSSQQLEWLFMLDQGASVATIARDACYSERQMYRLLRQLYAQFGVEERREAMKHALMLGLLAHEGASKDE